MNALPFDMPDLGGPALCAETDPEAFFPEKGHTSRDAKRVCAGCEVRLACLEWALAGGEHGVWGGTSEKERQRMRARDRVPVPRRQLPINHGTQGGYRTHLRRGEPPCESCVAAERERDIRRGKGAAA